MPKDNDLKLVIAGEEVLVVKYKPQQTSSKGTKMPFSTRGFQRVETPVGELRISLNVIE